MKKFRCPWCGEQCIPSVEKAFYPVGRTLYTGHRCPHCNKRFLWQSSRFDTVLGVLFLVIFLGLMILGGVYRFVFYYVGIGFLLFAVFVVIPVKRYVANPIMRCGSEYHKYAVYPIETPFSIRTEQPVSLRQEDIFAIRFTEGQYTIVTHRELKDAEIPVRLEKGNDPTHYHLGFLKPEQVNIEAIPPHASITLVLADDKQMPATWNS